MTKIEVSINLKEGMTEDQKIRAFPPKQTLTPPNHVCFVPKATFRPLFDHLVGAGKQRERHGNPEGLGGLEVDHQFKIDGLLNGQLAWFRTLENKINI